MPHLLFILFFFTLGACIGSFLNVVVWRLPRGESLVSPPSRCPYCEHRLAFYDNVPVFGWLWLRGRCRYCFNPISARYPTVEFITGAVFSFYYIMLFTGDGVCGRTLDIRHDWPIYLMYVFALSCLLAASLIDAAQFWIPQSIPLLLAGIGLLYHTILGGLPVGARAMPGELYLAPDGVGGLAAAGGGIGLVISLILLWRGKLIRSFALGYPALEVDQEVHQEAEPKQGWAGRLVGRWIESFRRKLTPQQKTVMEKAARSAEARDKEEAARQVEEMKSQPQPPAKEFTAKDIRREMRHEMAFLVFPMAGAILAVFLGMHQSRLPGDAGAHWVARPFWQGWMHISFINGFLSALLGGLVGALAVWLTRILGSMAFGREAMGMGDVDLMFGVGAIIGAGPVTVAFFIAPFFGLALALYMLLTGKRRELPYGPYLSLGTAFVLLYYCPIAEYLGLRAVMVMIRSAY